jgi:hypothetical protein
LQRCWYPAPERDIVRRRERDAERDENPPSTPVVDERQARAVVTAVPAAAKPAAAEPRRWRRIVPWILVVLAAILLLVGSLTVWAKRQLLDTNNWQTTSSQLLENEQIRTAIATYLVDQLYSQVNVTAELQQQLPPRVKALAAPLAAALESVSLRATEALLARPAVQRLWRAANVAAHKQFLIVIEGGKRVQTSGGEVVLDLSPILDRLAQSSVGAKVVAKLPPDAGRIVIMKSNQLKAAQTGVRVVKALSIVLTLIVLALFAAAVWITPRRRHMILAIGVTGLLCGLLLLVARRFLGNYVVDALAKNAPDFKPPAHAAWLIGTHLLRNIGVNLMIYGAAILAAGLIAGPSRVAHTLRRWVAPTLVHHPLVVYGLVALGFLLLTLLGPTDAQRLVPLIVLFAFGFLGVHVLRRQVTREFPDAVQARPAGI